MYFISVSPAIGQQCLDVNKMVGTPGKGPGEVCAVLFSWHRKGSDIFRPNPLIFFYLSGWGWDVLRGGSLLVGPCVEETGPKLTYEMSLPPEGSLYPFHPLLGEEKVKGTL